MVSQRKEGGFLERPPFFVERNFGNCYWTDCFLGNPGFAPWIERPVGALFTGDGKGDGVKKRLVKAR